jgi:TfoX/Sxy family transcriptional regulator of competence genes
MLNRLAVAVVGVPDEIQAERIRHQLARRKHVAERKMFGGTGFLLNGNLLVGVWKHSLCVRVGPEQAERALLEPHVNVFDIVSRPMKGWLLVEPESINSDNQLKRWIQRAATFVGKLPAKE